MSAKTTFAPQLGGNVLRNDRTAAQSVAAALDNCAAALQTPEMRHVARRVAASGFRESDLAMLIDAAASRPASAHRVIELRHSLGAEPLPAGMVETFLLLHTACRNRAALLRLGMGDGVLRCLADELRFLAAPTPPDRAQLLAASHGFISMAKVVTMRRFPAGQLQFEPSAIPISWILRHEPRKMARLAMFLGRHLRGRGPVFFHHLAWRRKNRFMLVEKEQNRSYHRIAQSLALKPNIKALVTESWLHSPETLRVSPHLAWLNKPFVECGGMIVELGDASEANGVFTGSAERRRLYEEGRFRPTTAMVIWPRSAMLDWAANHTEFAD